MTLNKDKAVSDRIDVRMSDMGISDRLVYDLVPRFQRLPKQSLNTDCQY